MKRLMLIIICCSFMLLFGGQNAYLFAWSHNEHFHNNTGQTAYDVHKILDGRYWITDMMRGQPFNSTDWYWRGNETVLRWFNGEVPYCQRGHCCFTAKPRTVYTPVTAIVKKAYWTDQHGAYLADCGPNLSATLFPLDWGGFDIALGNFGYFGELDDYFEPRPPFEVDQIAVAFVDGRFPIEELTVENVFEGGLQLDWQEVMTRTVFIEQHGEWIDVDTARAIPQVDHGFMLLRAAVHEAENLAFEVFQFEIVNGAFTRYWTNQEDYHNNTGQTAYDLHKILDGEYYIADMYRATFPITHWYHRKDETVLIWKGAAVPHCTNAHVCFRALEKKQIRAKIKKAYWTDKQGAYIGDYGPASSVKLELKKDNIMELAVGNYRYLGPELQYTNPAPPFVANQIDVAFTHEFIPMESLVYDNIFVANPFNLNWIPQDTLSAKMLRKWNHLRPIEEYNNEPFAVVRVAVQEGEETYHDMYCFELEGLEPLQPSADFYDDGYVGLRDFQEFGDNWHLTSKDTLWNRQYNLDNPEPPHWGETEPVQEIGLKDFQIFGDLWHTGTPSTTKYSDNVSVLRAKNPGQGIRFDLDELTVGNQNKIKEDDPPSGIVHVRIDIYAKDVNKLDSYEFNVLYDQTEFKYVDASPSNPSTFEQNILTTLGGTGVGPIIDSSTPGVLNFAYTLQGSDPAQAPNGDGLLASVVFEVLQKDIKKWLKFGDVEYIDVNGVSDKNIDKAIDAYVSVDMIATEEIPEAFDLAQSYPNPFNAECIIKYQLPEKCHVTLKIYNMNGQEVATLVSGDKKAGYYNVIWNGTDMNGHIVANGIYFYTLETNGFKMTRKMTLLK